MEKRISSGYKIIILFILFDGCLCTSYYKETIVAPPYYYSPPQGGYRNFAHKENSTAKSVHTTDVPVQQSPLQDKNVIKVFYTKPVVKGNETHYQIHLVRNNQISINKELSAPSVQAHRSESNTKSAEYNHLYRKLQTAPTTEKSIKKQPTPTTNPFLSSAASNEDNKVYNQEHDDYPEESVYNSNIIKTPFQRLARFIDHNVGDQNYLYLPPKLNSGFNSPNHLSTDPFIELLLSHYGKYLPVERRAKPYGLYSYSATNNFHNNLPFGNYKVYEDSDGD